jgi:hypothetical protein
MIDTNTRDPRETEEQDTLIVIKKATVLHKTEAEAVRPTLVEVPTLQ